MTSLKIRISNIEIRHEVKRQRSTIPNDQNPNDGIMLMLQAAEPLQSSPAESVDYRSFK
jgi:hypothetical protein